MITVSNAKLGLEMAERLGVRQIKSHELIDKLYSLSISPAMSEALHKDTDWCSLEAKDINLATKLKGADEMHHHDIELESVVDMVDRGVSAIMDLTSNTVNPLAKEVVAKIKEECDYKVASLQPPQIRPIFVPNFEKVQFLEDMLIEDSAKTQQKVVLPKEFTISATDWESKTSTERMALVNSTNPKLNEFLGSLIEQEDRVELGAASTGVSPMKAILNYAYVSRLMTNPLENINMTLAEYNLILLKAKKQYARSAIAGVKQMTRKATSGYLIAEQPERGLNSWSIRVYGETYNKWIAEGGNVEALYGLVHGKLGDRKVGELKEYKHYEKIYNDWKRHQEMLIASSYKQVAFDVVTRELTSWGSEKSSDIPPREIETQIKKVIRESDNPRVNNIDRWVRLIIVNTFMANNSIMEFIDEMSEIARNNPDLPIAECAELARLHVIGDWLASLVV